MPSRLDSPVLSLSINNITKIDTHNVDNLFGMWTIFSRCAESLENGRRLENLSWRLWNQETFYHGTDSKFMSSLKCPEASTSSASSLRLRSNTSSTEEIPALSSSVESATSSSNASRFDSSSLRSVLSRRDSYKGKDRHMNPIDLAKLMGDLGKNEVEHIIEEHAKSPERHSEPQIAQPIAVPTAPATANRDSTTNDETLESSPDSQSSIKSSHSIVRGFRPGQVSNSYRSSTKLAPVTSVKEQTPVEVIADSAKPKKGAMFIVGSSPSDASDSYTESRFGSALTNSLRRSGSNGSKRAAFADKVTTRMIVNEDEDDDEEYISDDDAIDDSAISDDDEEWEEEEDESGESSFVETTMFARVEETRPVLPSRRSLLSTLLHQDDRAAALARAGTRSAPAIRSRTASPNGPSVPASPSREAPLSHIMGARAVPIVATNTAHPPALSPRTTRRNMLATELTESLRKHLLWERQQKNKVANAVLRRRHTAYDMQNMNEYPQQDRAGSWNNNPFDQAHNEYHMAGW